MHKNTAESVEEKPFYTVAEVEAMYKKIAPQNQKFLDEVMMADKGVKFKDWLIEFFEAHEDGSAESNAAIRQYIEEFRTSYEEAHNAEDDNQKRFYSILSEMELFDVKNALPAVVTDEQPKSEVRPKQKPVEPNALRESSATNAAPPTAVPEAKKYERLQQKIDIKYQIKKFVDQTPYSVRQLFTDTKWEDPKNSWAPTGDNFIDGFNKYLCNEIDQRDGMKIKPLEELVKALKKHYEEIPTTESKDREFAKAKYEVAKKMMDVFTGEEKVEADKRKNLLGVHWSWENIKFTIGNVRRQLLELVMGKGADPWFDYATVDPETGLARPNAKHAAAPKRPVADRLGIPNLNESAANGAGGVGRNAASGGGTKEAA